MTDADGRHVVSLSPDWFIGFKDVTAPTNVRTMIAAVVPWAAAGNTLPILLPEVREPPQSPILPEEWKRFKADVNKSIRTYVESSPLVIANLNSFAYDYFARQKVHGQHLNYFIVEQLPVLPKSAYGRVFKKARADESIRSEVLHLTYTATDMAPFARDMGHKGPPFRWDEEERRHRRARLDAIYFHLYGIGKDDAAYILDTFPIVKREDEERYGRYLTKDLILAYMNAVAAGDVDTIVSI
jgi:hypothetical protein